MYEVSEEAIFQGSVKNIKPCQEGNEGVGVEEEHVIARTTFLLLFAIITRSRDAARAYA